MGIYISPDIEVDDGGEVQFENGDVKIASVKRSHLQALHWVIASNRGDTIYGDAVANLGTYLGALNVQRTQRAMEEEIRRALLGQRLFLPGDVQVRVVPVDLDQVAVLANLLGTFLEQDPAKEDDGYATLAYVFTFGTGAFVRVDQES